MARKQVKPAVDPGTLRAAFERELRARFEMEDEGEAKRGFSLDDLQVILRNLQIIIDAFQSAMAKIKSGG